MEIGKKIKSFSQITGQETAINFLKRVISGGKIPHAFLFTGIEGVGKTTTALAFCQAINCMEPVNREGCGSCLICRQMISGNFPDLIFIEPEGQNIKIEQIRDLNRSLSFKPVTGAYRVIVINRAEIMTPEAANSFLKTLEEPPLGNVIILKVKEPLDLLPTIVSRCQRIPFRPLPRNIVKEFIKKEKDIDEENAALIAGISDGSIGRAIQISGEDYLEERQKSISNIIQLAAMEKTQAIELAMEYAQDFKKKNHGSSTKIGLFELIGIWKTWYRDLIIEKVNGPVNLLINSDFSRKLKALSKNLGLASLLQGFFLLEQAQMDLMRNPNTGIMIENLFLDLKNQGHTPDRKKIPYE